MRSRSGNINTLKLLFALPPLGLAGLLAAAILPVESSSANSSLVTASLNAVDYTLNVSAENVNLEVSTTPDGRFVSQRASVLVETNASTGYRLYLSMNTDDENGNYLYRTDDGVIDTTNYLTATTTQTTEPDLNSWGYSLDGSTWQAVPLLSGLTLIDTNSTTNTSNSMITGTKEVYYGVKADDGMRNGDYQGTVLYTALAYAVSESYTKLEIDNIYGTSYGLASKTSGTSPINGTVSVTTGLITTQDLTASGAVTMTVGGTACRSVTADQSSGYLVATCELPNKSTGTYNIVISIPSFNKTYTISSAVPYVRDFYALDTLQQMTSTVCGTVYTPSNATGSSATLVSNGLNYTTTSTGTANVPQTTLRDARDDQTYTVRKLADGNCWMTSNLALKLSAGQEYTSDTTDLTTKSSWTVTSTHTGNHVTGSYGTYYNWYAATAGTGTSSSRSTTINDSICPKNWRLPYGTAATDSKSWANLFNAYGFLSGGPNVGTNVYLQAPLSIIKAGRYVSGYGYNGSVAYYWSATSGSSSGHAYILFINESNSVSTAYLDTTYNDSAMVRGLTVRCVAK